MSRRKQDEKNEEEDFEIITNVALLNLSGSSFLIKIEKILKYEIICIKHPVIELMEKIEKEITNDKQKK